MTPLSPKSKLLNDHMSQKLRFSEEEYGALIERLAVNLRDSGVKPSVVLAVARGGLRVGDILSRLFGVPLAIVSASSYQGQTQGQIAISPVIPSEDSLRGLVLIADDLVDSGVTMSALASRVSSRPGVTGVHRAVIWAKSGSESHADTYVNVVPREVWIDQPFEVYDDPDSLKSLK